MLLEILKDFLGISNAPEYPEHDVVVSDDIKESKLEELRDLTEKMNGD